jgi:hypothetical protein
MQRISISTPEPGQAYPQGTPPAGFLDRLALFVNAPVARMLSLLECPLCGAEDSATVIMVFGADNRVYGTTGQIEHFVIDHHYLPPDDFIAAVLTGPEPGTSAYQEKVAQASAATR